MTDHRQPVRRALLSVSDKTGLLPLAQALAAKGVVLLSTGGTAKALREAGLAVTDVSSVTGFPEIMDGRVKTLHPTVHGGLLGRAGIDDAVMAQHGIDAIDLLVVNLYPFEATVAKPDCTYEGARRGDAAKGYAHPARYDGKVSMWLSARVEDEAQAAEWPSTLNLQLDLTSKLRSGENPHQRGALYVERGAPMGIVATAQFLQGKELSYNNLADADAALECVKQFHQPACVIVKHANPCGVAVAQDIFAAYDRAYATDPTSAFGGIIAFNRPLDADVVEKINANKHFVEVAIAPSITPAARAAYASKVNVRLLEVPFNPVSNPLDMKRVGGGMLLQSADSVDIVGEIRVVTRLAPTEQQMQDLLFAWKVGRFVKSNAIVFCKDGMTYGVGAGQMSRLDSARIASIKAQAAGLSLDGTAVASDAFFPFRDGLDVVVDAGATCVIHPGGSMRDQEVIDAADERGIAMVFTGTRHFRH